MTEAELNDPNFSSIIAEPVWDNEVQYFFDAQDQSCMNSNGIMDLASYSQVSDLSAKVYYYVYYKIMPLGKTKWNENKLFSFRNWLTHGCPENQAALDAFKENQDAIAVDTSLRQRKNINDVVGDEKTNLIKALKGVMALPNDDPKSYYQLGGMHWYPAPTYCEHHIQPFLAWHRAYLLQFENALRSIPGCEDVTLPYWDISDDTYPAIFSEDPFIAYQPQDANPSPSSYLVPEEFRNQYPQEITNGSLKSDGSIIRNDETTYNLKKWANFRDANHNAGDKNKIDLAKIPQFPSWNTFNGIGTDGNYLGTLESLMNAHDTIHNINGATTRNQDVTGFEPVFWLFHAYWDRMMWQWQKLHNTTTLSNFKNNVQAAGDSTKWIDGEGLNMMDPFTETLGLTVDKTINLNDMGINYVDPPLPLTKPESFAATEMSLHRSAKKGQSTKSAFKMNNFSQVSLRVKNVDRLKIPGAFTVSLYLGGELLQTRFFLQATKPGDCANCVKQALVSFDFEFANERLQKADGNVKVEVQLSREDEDGNLPVIPFREIGNPTINIRLIH
ncbi:MAG: tyrosinase family protein [Candidatus Electrothrix sp. GM3_4]|nr:tyrosinase family protein [Candidatus Electrothrix sp. GM3_4]